MTLLPRLEAGLVAVLLRLLRALPPEAASNLAGGVARQLGPLLPVSRVARENLRAALPEMGPADRRQVIRGMWEQLGRTAGEFPHIARLAQNTESGPGWQVEGEDILAALARQGGPAIFFSGHIGNWEILPRASRTYGMPCASLYRAAQNRAVDQLIRALRQQAAGETLLLLPKGARGARQAVAHLARGGFLAMLVDQKLNDGIAARFFGLPAMTAPSVASFALHFRCPVVPALAQRIGPARLRLVIEPPLELPDSSDRAADILALTQQMNDVLERWIRAAPESWLWMHRRWPKDVVKL